MKRNGKPGFTLIELMVVIVIISILTGIILVALRLVRFKAQDARRKSDISSLARTLERYSLDNNDTYPISNGVESLGQDSNSGADKALLDGEYLKFMPTDSFRGASDPYHYYHYISTDGRTYILDAKLSNGKLYQASGNNGVVTYREVAAITDTTPPVWKPGAQLTIVKLSSSEVNLTWSPATDNSGDVRFRVQEGIDIKASAINGLTVNISGLLSPPALHTFRVFAYDLSDNETGGPWGTIDLTSSDSTPPTWPDSWYNGVIWETKYFSASSSNPNQIWVRWSKAADANPSQYIRFVLEYQKVGAADWSSVFVFGSSGNTGSTYLTLNKGTYNFKVKAIDNAGNATYYQINSSPTVIQGTITAGSETGDVEPPIFTGDNIQFQVVGDEIRLTWSPAWDNVGVVRYEYYVCTSYMSNCSMERITTQTYVTVGLVSEASHGDTIYRYLEVWAFDAAGNSAFLEGSATYTNP